ncbi:MAG: hypothetical protein P0116_07930 [Candidatus Nitrosocosmicus sp.]|nr:hypothetical protein [Candidatus Nitrosocosmicus sp.]
MKKITNLLLLLIVTLFILPASATLYARGSPENSERGGSSYTGGSFSSLKVLWSNDQ